MTLLRIRGGISGTLSGTPTAEGSSPHTRRYFPKIVPISDMLVLFSAYAEVFPSSPSSVSGRKTLLRIRGGISIAEKITEWINGSSPHTRRYFQPWVVYRTNGKLFSAYAEVFPCARKGACPSKTLLRIRGGISNLHCSSLLEISSSPHTRRYFQVLRVLHGHLRLFSAYAEVFPSPVYHAAISTTLLRTRGGISSPAPAPFLFSSSSPHARRYFRITPRR